MLGYISSTRKKSCRACVKAKRRCDLGFPICSRCTSKSLECSYPTVRNAKVVVRQTTPDLLPDPVFGDSQDPSVLGVDQTCQTSIDTNILPQHATSTPFVDSTWFQSSEGSSSPENVAYHDNAIPYDTISSSIVQLLGGSPNSETSNANLTRPTFSLSPTMPQIWEPTYLQDKQTMFIVNRLCTLIPSMAYSGHTLFMHENLWNDVQPEAYQDTCSIAALYLVRTNKTQSVLAKSIENKIASLIASSATWSLEQHLAAVQSLIIYQIIRLFDPTLCLQEQAHSQIRLLEVWTAHLWKRSFNEMPAQPLCHELWVFQESLRRTVMISVFLRGAWSCFARGGYCDMVPVLARLPILQDKEFWSASPTEWEIRNPCTAQSVKGLVNLGEYTSKWSHDAAVEKLSDFERLMLAACRGKDDARLLEED